jgi:hypothetical protein
VIGELERQLLLVDIRPAALSAPRTPPRTASSCAPARGQTSRGPAEWKANRGWMVRFSHGSDATAVVRVSGGILVFTGTAQPPGPGGLRPILTSPPATDPVLHRVVDMPWPLPPNYPHRPPASPRSISSIILTPPPGACGDLLNSLGETKPLVLARRTARARAIAGPLAGNLLQLKRDRRESPRVEGDPTTDTRAAVTYLVGVL